ncbi:MAG: hypothetical protein Q7R40_14375 [Phaeospirillum sp.]|nr:hypothetical protein [Phaeospirillum sp.]
MAEDKTRYMVTVLDPNSAKDREVYTWAYTEDQAKRNVMLREGIPETDIVSVKSDSAGDDEDDDIGYDPEDDE